MACATRRWGWREPRVRWRRVLRHHDAEAEATPQTRRHRRGNHVRVGVRVGVGLGDEPRDEAADQRADARVREHDLRAMTRPVERGRDQRTGNRAAVETERERAVLEAAEVTVAVCRDRAECGRRRAEQDQVADERRLPRRQVRDLAVREAARGTDRTAEEQQREHRRRLIVVGRLDQQRAVRGAEQQADRRGMRRARVDRKLLRQQVTGATTTREAREQDERDLVAVGEVLAREQIDRRERADRGEVTDHLAIVKVTGLGGLRRSDERRRRRIRVGRRVGIRLLLRIRLRIRLRLRVRLWLRLRLDLDRCGDRRL